MNLPKKITYTLNNDKATYTVEVESELNDHDIKYPCKYIVERVKLPSNMGIMIPPVPYGEILVNDNKEMWSCIVEKDFMNNCKSFYDMTGEIENV